MAIADNLTPKELELANLVDFYNEVYTGSNYKHKLKKGVKLRAIIMRLVSALNAESKNVEYRAVYDRCIRLYKNNRAISHREFYDSIGMGHHGK